MKFNIDAFKRFNKYVNTPEKVQLSASVSVYLLRQNRPLVTSYMLYQL